jgi:hypothetical protein
MYTHLVGLDNYYIEYSVKVGAFNEHGSGPNSTEHIIMSAEGSKYHQLELNYTCCHIKIVYPVFKILK